MPECLFFLFDRKRQLLLKLRRRCADMAVLQEARNDQITGHIPTGIFHTLFLEVSEAKMQ